ncbi:putative COP9 signalosome complex subunit 7b-like [Apostichopus japonicus]|uniref:Putative COP9 signalosome complex subunit 7b-like n=1 Tax=Stichopus japonicus TaxID=307972 RepID=A0A2G8LDC8_STIJA|nr:putative COP9 signalosome complex subunit 7b-like [Apostichopus japonicus]
MAECVKTSTPLEQYVLLAKGTKGAAAVGLIKQVLEAPGVYVFGELLEMPNIQELSDGASSQYLDALNLFAFGTYHDYKENKSRLPELSEVALKKLKQLTVVALAAKTKRIPYTDLIIECIYAGILQGKLDQNNQQLEVEYAIGRDIRPEAVSDIINVLQEWCDGCETVLANIEEQITKANKYKEIKVKTKQKIQDEVENIKKAIKATSSSQEGNDTDMGVDTREVDVSSLKPVKKSSKMKGLRGSGKFWTKSN